MKKVKVYMIVHERYDHSFPAPAGCFSEDGVLEERKVVKAFFSKDKRDKEFKKPEYRNKYDGEIVEDDGLCVTYDTSDEYSTEEIEVE